MIKIAIADDHLLFLEGISELLGARDELNICIKAGNGRELLDSMVEGDIPDIVFLDLDMPILDGYETLKVLNQEFPEVKVVILSMHQDESIVLHMIEKGARAYLLKNAPFDQVLLTIDQLMKIGYYYQDSVIEIMRKGLMVKTRKRPVIGNNIHFTGREMEVLLYICQGRTAAEISEKLFLSPRTVEGHKRNLLEKTNVKNTPELIIYCLKNNIVTLDEINLDS